MFGAHSLLFVELLLSYTVANLPLTNHDVIEAL